MRKYYTKETLTPDKDCALKPPLYIYGVKEDDADYGRMGRRWQAGPTIAKTPNGRLWVGYAGGGRTEGPNNYLVSLDPVACYA